MYLSLISQQQLIIRKEIIFVGNRYKRLEMDTP